MVALNFYIADLHFGHKNNMAYDNRPFSTIEENDNVLIDNWNSVVNIDDDVYILGDLSYHNVTETTKIVNQLNGNKHLCVGNHDKRFLKNRFFRDSFVEICDYKELDIDDGKKLILCHYPMPCFNGQFRGNYHFYAHVHNTEQWNMIEYFKKAHEDKRGVGTCNMINVGCMMPWMKFCPKTFTQILDSYNGVSNGNQQRA